MNKIPANRVAAGGASVAAVAAAVVSVLGAVDTTPKAIVVSVALIAVAAVVVVFLLGSQKHEAATAWMASGFERSRAIDQAAKQRQQAVALGQLDPDLDPSKGDGENVARELGVFAADKTDPAGIPADRGDAEVAEKRR